MNRYGYLLVVMFVLAGRPAAAPLQAMAADDVDTFWARHRKALGGDKGIEASTSLILSGKVTRGDTVRSFRWTLVSPSLFREDIEDAQGVVETVATDGQNVWTRSVNGTARSVQGCFRNAVKFAGSVLARGYLDPEDLGWHVEGLEDTPEGVRVSANREDGTAVTLLFQGKKPLLSSASVPDPTCTLTLQFDDYEKHGKTRLPGRVVIVQQVRGEPVTRTYEITSVKMGTDITPESFERPDMPLSRARFDADTPVSLPLIRDAWGRPFVMLTMNDTTEGCWLIDSRATRSTVPPGQIEALKLEPAGTWDWWCGGSPVTRYRLPKLSASGFEMGPVLVAPGEVSGPHDQRCGILGADLLRRLVVSLLFRPGQVAFQDPDQFVDNGAGDALPLDDFDRAIVLLNGRTVLPVGIGTAEIGAPVVLRGPAVQSNGLEPPSERRWPLKTGEALQADDYLGLLDSLQIGGTTLLQVPVRFQRTPSPCDCGLEPAPTLGPRLLERFGVVLDLAHRQVIVTPDDQTTRPFPFDRSGLALAPDASGHLVVHRDASGSDIRTGDIILAVKAGNTWDTSVDAIVQAVEAPAGTVVKLKVQRGERVMTRQLTLEDP